VPPHGTPQSVYEERRAARAKELSALEARAQRISILRLVSFGAGAALLIALAFAPLPSWVGFVVGALFVAFVALVVVHARVFEAKERVSAAVRFYDRALLRTAGRYRELPTTGERFASGDHLYADDLDVFGRGSLFARLDTTETRFGEERLAALLDGRGIGAFPEDVRARQVAVEELAPKIDFRERLSAAGAGVGPERPNPEPFLRWVEGGAPFEPGILPVVAWVVPALTIGTFALAPVLGYARGLAIVPFLVGLALTSRVRRTVSEIAEAVSVREGALARYGETFATVEGESFASPLLAKLRATLGSGDGGATREMGKLGRIIGFLDARQNEVFRIFVGPVLLWDLHCVIALERWRRRVGGAPRAWLVALGELEALASLGAFRFEDVDASFPELSSSACFVAEGLAHPLLPTGKRVGNDVTLPNAGTALIVSGSNMSGKSTLLRAMGTNAVLAMAGAPVCAKRLAIGPVHVATSMRIRDSLEAGVSHFFAELQKLKKVVDEARKGEPVLFLLDEILHGTNSRERLIGARAIVRELLSLGALGAVSTHDLGMSDLEQSLDGKVKNVHFEEQVTNETMTFDYKLRHGVVTSSNALRLMRVVGLDIVPVD
jgi:hypothetical protein